MNARSETAPVWRRAGTFVGIAAAVALAVVGIARGTWAVGGSDSSCYGLMADAFARGQLQPHSALAATAPWPNASLTLAPGGFIPSPRDPTAASPICAPGFSLLLAPFRWLGGPDAIFLVTPLAAAALVWSAFVAARVFAGPLAGVIAALLTISAPVVLFQVVQPMNDIMSVALVTGVLAVACSNPARRHLWIGILTGAMFLVRPNLAPVCLVIAAWVFLTTTEWRPRLQFVFASLPWALLVLMFNALLYGHPLGSGYGATGDLFSLAHVDDNVRNHGRALLETQFALPLLGLLAPVALREKRSEIWLALGIAAAVIGLYLLYRPFPEWWYLRFLLPAMVPLLILSSAVVVRIVSRSVRSTTSANIANAVLLAVTVGVAVYGFRIAEARQAFELQRLESRFRETGHVVRDRLPSNAVLLAVWQSGSMRYHATREAVLWESLDPAWLDRAIAWLRQQGHEPFIVVEQWEEPLFRQRFAATSELGQLDWPPRFDVNRQARIFAPDDRARYLCGERVATEYVSHQRRK